MTRKEFIEIALFAGISMPLLSSGLVKSCDKSTSITPRFQSKFSGKIIIVGAGAAGLAAGYLLNHYGIDFKIFEAAPVIGGRLKKVTNFADFPIDLGAEWIHKDPKILNKILNNYTIQNFDTMVYNPQTIQSWKNGKLKSHNYIKSYYSEWKFKNSSWLSFFEHYIVPDIKDKIVLNNPIVNINYQDHKVILSTNQNITYTADKVLITSSIKTLQNNQINFLPSLPLQTIEAINNIYMGDGIKIFIEFKEKFYPDILVFGNLLKAFNDEDKIVYDAAFQKQSNKNILGLFAINSKATDYIQMGSDQDILSKVIAELDEIFDGKASSNYLNHIIQNWSAEPYIQGAYSYLFNAKQQKVVQTLKKPIANKIFFAGEALSIKNQATVHGACESAYNSIEAMLKNT